MIFNAYLVAFLVAPVLGAIPPKIYSIWAGALITEPVGTIKTVSSDILVPSLLPPSNADPSVLYGASVWVGIDGTQSCFTNKGLLQTGVQVHVDADFDISCYVWYEWYPSNVVKYSSIGCSPGDFMTISVTATSTTTGKASVINHTTGQSASANLNSTFQGTSYPLCLQYADFIVEAKGGKVADWEPIQFFNPKVVLADGTTQTNAATATPAYMVQSSTTLAVSTPTSTAINVNYVGP